MPDPVQPEPIRSALFTDLYELTMARAYDAEAMAAPAVFELIFREMPASRNYCIAAGLDDVLTYLEEFHFTEDDVAYLRTLGLFPEAFLERLKRLRFTGDVYAVAEGTPVFANEPLIQVVAPILEAQVVETLILNQIHFQTVAATKAARVVAAAQGRMVVDFGSRRAHGTDAAMKVARTSYLVGAAGTSLVAAGQRYGIPVFGTMAHSYLMAHESEADAFAAFARLYPNSTLLVDTYDTLSGVRQVIELSRRLGEGFRVHALRLDSGDIGTLARETRRLLDAVGLTHVQIFVSNEMDEHRMARLLAAGAPIDGFGVGTRLAVADDVPHLDMAYKLVEYAGRPRMKLSSHKLNYPGRKQIFRIVENGRIVRDVVGRHDETLAGEPLLIQVMRGGVRSLTGQIDLNAARRHALCEQERLPDALRSLERVEPPYPVSMSEALEQDFETMRRQLGAAK